MEFNVGLFREVFCEIDCQVLLRWDVLVSDDELSLSNAVSDSVETHVDSFAALLFNTIIGRDPNR